MIYLLEPFEFGVVGSFDDDFLNEQWFGGDFFNFMHSYVEDNVGRVHVHPNHPFHDQLLYGFRHRGLIV